MLATSIEAMIDNKRANRSARMGLGETWLNWGMAGAATARTGVPIRVSSRVLSAWARVLANVAAPVGLVLVAVTLKRLVLGI